MTKSSPEIPEFKIVTDEPFKECDRPAFTTAFDELFISSVHTESLVYTRAILLSGIILIGLSLRPSE